MHLPNYKNGSIVNLMSSILKARGGKPQYGLLRGFDLDKNSKNIILLVIDGLGYEYLMKYGSSSLKTHQSLNDKESFLKKNLKAKITSVFPPTTAACVTTFYTGVAPQQHAVTGWFMHLKELGVVSTILRCVPRSGGLPFDKIGIDPRKIFTQKSFFDIIKTESFIINPKKFFDSVYNDAFSSRAKRIYYNDSDLSDYFKKIIKIISSSNRKKFIYAYWPDFDGLCHRYGTKSKKVLNHFKEVDEKLVLFLNSIKESVIIITADHGLVDVDKSKFININKHPKFKETLILPLCGDARTAYCYVHPSKTKQFENYVKKHFKGKCRLHKSEGLIKKNYFGFFKPNKSLADRVGDYILIAEKDYAIKDFVLGERRPDFIGNHGGISKEEMFVPLIVVKK